METIGQRIKHLRESKGYSLRQLGERINISYTHIYRIESGEKTPNLDLLELLSKFFNVPMTYFFDEEEKYVRVEVPPILKENGVEWIEVIENARQKNLSPKQVKKLIDIADFFKKDTK